MQQTDANHSTFPDMSSNLGGKDVPIARRAIEDLGGNDATVDVDQIVPPWVPVGPSNGKANSQRNTLRTTAA
jgi:hypothetical protein